jgi:hypothetical protein
MMLLGKSGAKLNEISPILDELTMQMAWKKEIVPKAVALIVGLLLLLLTFDLHKLSSIHIACIAYRV